MGTFLWDMWEWNACERFMYTANLFVGHMGMKCMWMVHVCSKLTCGTYGKEIHVNGSCTQQTYLWDMLGWNACEWFMYTANLFVGHVGMKCMWMVHVYSKLICGTCGNEIHVNGSCIQQTYLWDMLECKACGFFMYEAPRQASTHSKTQSHTYPDIHPSTPQLQLVVIRAGINAIHIQEKKLNVIQSWQLS